VVALGVSVTALARSYFVGNFISATREYIARSIRRTVASKKDSSRQDVQFAASAWVVGLVKTLLEFASLWLLLALVGLIVFERLIAMRRNPSSNAKRGKS
jgi:hypothetical protein